MRNQNRKIAIGATGLAMVASIWLFKAHAQGNKLSSTISTNWIGCVVVGKTDSHDAIALGPYPQCVQQFQLGLRSDGVVLWRPAAPALLQQR